jgi:hypothetical protein
VVLGGPDAAPARYPDHHRDLGGPRRAEPVLGDVGDDLIQGRIRERLELHLGNRSPSRLGQPQGHAGDPRFRERCVEHPALAELGLKLVGDPEYPTQLPNVLPEEEHPIVLFQTEPEALVQRLSHGELRHPRPLP